MKHRYTLTIIVPAYNEEAVIYKNLISIAETVYTFCPNYEIIAVNDGSSDQTRSEILRARKENSRIKMVSYQKNRGKGGAIKAGVTYASGAYIAFLDADLDLPAEQLETFYRTMLEQDTDIVIGSKLHKDSKLHYPLTRKIMSYGYYLLLRILFHLKIKDTQTGIKLFRSEILKPIITQLETSGYAYDIELLARAVDHGFQIVELPITLNYSRNDKEQPHRIRIFDVIEMFLDTLAIYYKLRKTDS